MNNLNNEYGTKTYIGRENYSVNSFKNDNMNINSLKTPSYITDGRIMTKVGQNIIFDIREDLFIYFSFSFRYLNLGYIQTYYLKYYIYSNYHYHIKNYFDLKFELLFKIVCC